MSTTGITTWATDLAEVGKVYPFQGTETVLLIIGLACWIGWHVWCVRWEQDYHRDKIRKYGEQARVREALDTD